MNMFERVAAEVKAERERQDEKWGVQNHPLTYPGSLRDAELYRGSADLWKAENDYRVKKATAEGKARDENCAWDGILGEEFAEAFGEERAGLQYSEFVQTAGVAFAIVEFLNRKCLAETGHYAACPALDVDWILTAPELCTCSARRFEPRDLNPGGPWAGMAWGVWDTRDGRWCHGFDYNSRGEAERYASRRNAEESS